MADLTRIQTTIVIVILVTLFGIIGVQFYQNQRMREVLINQTIVALDREYEQARVQEQQLVADMYAQLQASLDELGNADDLLSEQRDRVVRARTLLDALRAATISEGIIAE